MSKTWDKFVSLSPWYLGALTVIFGIICVFALRSNYEHMTKLRQALYTADKNDGNVTAALVNLQSYVTSHMNTELSSGPNAVYPPIQLKYSYERAVSSAGGQLNSVNSALYTEAEDYCQSAIPNGFSGRYRIPCIEQYIQSHGQQQNNIDQSLYEFDFVSPLWSPDLAGWTLIITILSLFLLLLNRAVNFTRKRIHKTIA